jgi:methionyl-tRNA synthetase
MDIPLEQVAKDVVNCYNHALVGFEHEVAVPGFFWVEGAYEDDPLDKGEGGMTAVEKLKKDHYKTLLEAEKKMVEWFRRLVRMADDDWAVLPQHQQISDIQRTAAKYVNVERPWLATDVSESKRCPACRTIVQTASAVCFACKFILDEEAYKNMKFATA